MPSSTEVGRLALVICKTWRFRSFNTLNARRFSSFASNRHLLLYLRWLTNVYLVDTLSHVARDKRFRCGDHLLKIHVSGINHEGIVCGDRR